MSMHFTTVRVQQGASQLARAATPRGVSAFST
jgi:hypothetical protein